MHQPSRPQLPVDIGAVAIDLDGTLLDTLPDIVEAADRMLTELGRPPVGPEIVRSYIGDGIPRLTKRLLTGLPDGEPEPASFEVALEAFERHYRDTFTRCSRPFPGVIPGLERMRAARLRLACVTNKNASFTLPLMEATGLSGYFELVVSGDSLPKKKPDPLPLLYVARQFALAPARLLVIGDSPVDTRAARAAGCPVFCVPYGYRGTLAVQGLACDAIVPTLPDVLDLIRIPRS
jgi:phosphoglycolate phosphatase